MDALTVAVSQPRTRSNDVAANAMEHARAIVDSRARLVVFPELSLTGYELDAEPVAVDDERLAPIIEVCAATRAVALVGLPVRDGGSSYIATVRVDADGSALAYRKQMLGGAESRSFAAGKGPAVIEVDGWRVGLGICKDTGAAGHIRATAELGIDLYAAGLVHRADEAAEQDRRGTSIAAECGAYVAFASHAGPTGGGYETTLGGSTIWSPEGRVMVTVGDRPGETAVAACRRAV